MNFESLIVPLVLAAEEYKKDLDKVEKDTEKSTKSMGSKLSSFAKNSTKALAGLAVAGFGVLSAAVGVSLNKTLEWGDTLDSIGDHLGTTTEDSAGLALMVERVGGSVDQLTGAMDIMTRGLTNAEGELGPTGLALQSLGISIFDANGKMRDSTAIFQDVANVLGNMPDGLQKTSLMMDIFGKSGGDMGDILGAAANGGLASFNQQAKDLGLAFSQDKVDAVIETKKKWEELKQIWDGIVLQLGTNLLPLLGEILNKVKAWVESEDGKQAMQNVSDTIEDFAKNAELLFDWLTKLTPEQLKLALSILEVAAALKIAWPLLIAVGGPVAWLIGGIATLAILWANLGKQVSETAAQIILIAEMLMYKLVYNVFGSINNAIAGVIDWFRRLRDSISQLSLPSWLKPGSPPPLYFALMNINEALKTVARNSLPEFSSELNIQGVVNPSFSDTTQKYGLSEGNSNSFDYDKLGRVVADNVLLGIASI